MKIVFVNYGNFTNNSAHHINGFADQLLSRGHEVGIIAGGKPDNGREEYSATPNDLIGGVAPKKLRCMLADTDTIIHAWTPRETVRHIVEPFFQQGLQYIVHLEDSEDLVTATQLGIGHSEIFQDNKLPAVMPGHLSHPKKSRRFLESASAVTVIVKTLEKDVPLGCPTYLLEPGVDCNFFKPRMSTLEIEAARRQIGIEKNAFVLVYNGNIHPAIERDVFSLFSAVRILRRNGFPVFLIRTREQDNITKRSDSFHIQDGVIDLGYVGRSEIPKILELADFFVQPGSPSPFNTFRLPSKILEFLAMSRPVILPSANIGLQLKNEVNAIVLREGGAWPIVDALQKLMADPAHAKVIGENGRKFIMERFSWTSKSEVLLDVYRSVSESRKRSGCLVPAFGGAGLT